MGVNVYWQSEGGDVLQQLFDPKMLLSGHVRATQWSESRCLRFIDPYGDAVFNHLQVPVLVEELEASIVPETKPDTAAHVRSVVAFLRERLGDRDVYAWFIGD